MIPSNKAVGYVLYSNTNMNETYLLDAISILIVHIE